MSHFFSVKTGISIANPEQVDPPSLEESTAVAMSDYYHELFGLTYLARCVVNDPAGRDATRFYLERIFAVNFLLNPSVVDLSVNIKRTNQSDLVAALPRLEENPCFLALQTASLRLSEVVTAAAASPASPLMAEVFDAAGLLVPSDELRNLYKLAALKARNDNVGLGDMAACMESYESPPVGL